MFLYRYGYTWTHLRVFTIILTGFYIVDNFVAPVIHENAYGGNQKLLSTYYRMPTTDYEGKFCQILFSNRVSC